MPIGDIGTVFDDGTTQRLATFTSTKLDFGTAVDPGKAAKRMQQNVVPMEAYNNLTSIKIDLIGADDTAGTNAVTVTSFTYLLADLGSGQVGLRLRGHSSFVPGTKKQVWYYTCTVTGTAPTTGKLLLEWVDDEQVNQMGY